MSLYFQDVMDLSRVVKPLEQKGRTTLCAIYMVDGHQLNFVGKAPIPSVLLEDPKDRPINRHIGFVPYSKRA